jgi:hypothetical protein
VKILKTGTRSKSGRLIKVAVVLIGATLLTGCTVEISLPANGSSSSNCPTCGQLVSEFPNLAILTLSELENLVKKYGPDVDELLLAAVLLIGE